MLYVVYPLVVGVGGLFLGSFLGEIGIFQVSSDGNLYMPGTIMIMVFGYLNCILIPHYLKFDQKFKPLNANILVGTSFFLTLFSMLFLAIFVYLGSGYEIPASGLMEEPRFMFMITLPGAPFISWFLGGFGLVWWKSERDQQVTPPVPPVKPVRPQRPMIEWGSKPVEIKWKPPPDQQFTHSQNDSVSTGSIDRSSPQLTFRLRNEQKVCQICRQKIGSEENTVSCPKCKTVYHYPHFAEWVKMKGECPTCHAELIIN